MLTLLKSIHNRFYKIVTICLLINNCSFAQYEEDNIRTFLQNINSVVNSRNDKVIDSFFSYYIDPQGYILKKTVVYNQQTDKILETSTKLTRKDYIKSILDKVNQPGNYDFLLNVSSVQNKGEYFLVTVAIKEITQKNNVIYTTCNLSVDYNDMVKINSMNCIEQIMKN